MLERVAESEFIGRDREIGLLEAGYREASAGHGRTLGIVGEPGIGKTRLVEEFTRRLDPSSDLVLWGRCPEGGGAPAYWPWRQALAPLLEANPHQGTASAIADDAQLETVLAVISGRRGRKGAELDTEQIRFTLLEAVVRLLRATSDRR